MSNSLKRSQKLCPKCKNINFIRQYNCTKCNFEFPKKDKTSNRNASIENFFFPNANKSEFNNNIKNDNFIELDELYCVLI